MLKDGFYNAAGGVLRAGLTFVTIPFLIRLLGISEYGLFALVSAAVGLAGLADAGFSGGTAVFVSRDLADRRPRAVASTLTISVAAMLLLASLVAGVLLVQARVIAEAFPSLGAEQRDVATLALRAAAVLVWARLLQSVAFGVEQACRRYRAVNVLSTLQLALSSLGALALAAVGVGIPGLMAWQAAVALGMLVVHVVYAWHLLGRASPRPVWRADRAVALARYSLLTWVSALGSVLFSQVDRVIVGALLGTSAVGIYAAITSTTAQINTLSALPVQPLVPRVSRLRQVTVEGLAALRQDVSRAFLLNVLVVAAMTGVFLVAAPILLPILAPVAGVSDYVLPFRIATVVYALYSLSAVGYIVLIVDAPALNGLITLLSGGLALVLIGVLASVAGLTGAIAGNLGYALTLIQLPLVVRRLAAAVPASDSFVTKKGLAV